MDTNDLIISVVAFVLAAIIAWSLSSDKHRFVTYGILLGCFTVFLIIGRIFFGPEMASLERVIERAPNPLVAEPMIPVGPRQSTPATAVPVEPPKQTPRHFQRLFIATRALMPKQTVHAPDNVVLRCFRVHLKIAEELLWKQPATLSQFLFSAGPKDQLLASHADALTQQAALSALTDLVRQAVTQPQPAPVPAVAELILDTITKDLEKTGGVDIRMLDLVEVTPEDTVKLCTTTLMFYKKILDLPPVTASHVIRHLAAPN
ncbi:MAG: hypothetical protein HZA91_11940 [Verrucomicrobia bacterium]|nr:hypothetical protein [Verrucomicrobiota bacterium]